ncbi:MAG: patatin-like phospholipase family protein [Bacteroidales bacterium]|nr:patatin-like phospholipase family protein [Bacteroidales bacterium]
MAYHFKNLVFEGGGVKGIAYVGALEVLNREGILKDIERVAGTSAGAMIAVLVGLGFSAEELKEVLWKINFKNFMDDSWGVVRDTKRLLKEYGWYKGDYFRSLMAGYIKEKTGNGEATFQEIEKMRESGKPFRDISLIGSDLSTGLSKVFNARTTPTVKVADAARISMSIPLFFGAIKGVNGDDHIYVDGGLLDNYYVKVFDRLNYVAEANNARRTDYYDKINEKMVSKRSITQNVYVYNKETLGFRLDGKEEIDMYLNPNVDVKPKEIKSLFTYTKALVSTLIDFQNNAHLHSDDWQRTVYIDTLGVKSIDFGLSDAKKTELVESGKCHTEAYLEWYNNDEEKANK